MLNKIFAIKDVKVGFMNPFVMQNDDIAKRSFKNMLHSNEKTLITMNPEDFELWSLGSLDSESGVITSKVDFICNSNISNEV